VQVKAYKQAPTIYFLEEKAKVAAFVKLDVNCQNKYRDWHRVIEIETSTDIEYQISIDKDITVKLILDKFVLEYRAVKNSSIGTIETRNIKQLLNLLSKIIYSVVNSLFGKGFKIPVPETFYYTLSGIEVGHKNGYLYIYATPNFEKIDLLQLFEIGITQISFSTLDLIRLLTTGTISD